MRHVDDFSKSGQNRLRSPPELFFRFSSFLLERFQLPKIGDKIGFVSLTAITGRTFFARDRGSCLNKPLSERGDCLIDLTL